MDFKYKTWGVTYATRPTPGWVILESCFKVGKRHILAFILEEDGGLGTLLSVAD